MPAHTHTHLAHGTPPQLKCNNHCTSGTNRTAVPQLAHTRAASLLIRLALTRLSSDAASALACPGRSKRDTKTHRPAPPATPGTLCRLCVDEQRAPVRCLRRCLRRWSRTCYHQGESAPVFSSLHALGRFVSCYRSLMWSCQSASGRCIQ
eukprot:scaffold77453_cov72-Phaeocystis_antarctica.AAC.10